MVDGLADGQVGLVTKMHHALVDGVAAVDVGTVLLDPSPEPLEIPPPDEPWSPRPYDPGAHIARLAATPFMRTQQFALDAARRALETSPRTRRGRAAAHHRPAARARAPARAGADDAAQRAARPQPPLRDRPRGPRGELKAAGKAAGGTVNDVLLAVVAGMLRRYLDAAGRRPGTSRSRSSRCRCARRTSAASWATASRRCSSTCRSTWPTRGGA